MGTKNMTVSAFFSTYPKIMSEEVFLNFDILDEPCAFEQFKLKPGQFKNVTVFLNDAQSVTQTFKFEDLITWNKTLDCGDLNIEFTTPRGEQLPSDIFDWT